MGRPIYYMTAKVTIIRNKKPTTRSVWIVSSYDQPLDIMRNDQKTMVRLQHDLYPAKAKNKAIVIDEIMTKRQVGTTSNQNQNEGNNISGSLQEGQKRCACNTACNCAKKNTGR